MSQFKEIFVNYFVTVLNYIKTNFGFVDATIKAMFLYIGYIGGISYFDKETAIMQLIAYFAFFIWVQAILLCIMIFMAAITGNYR